MQGTRIGPALSIAAGLAAALAAAPALAEEPLDILYFGNSFTLGFGSTRSVPAVVADLAVAAGHPTPDSINAAASGQSLAWHLANNTSVITTSIPPNESWDFVVLQDFSTAPTRLGDVTAHRASTLALYQRVAEHSPAVVPVLYETWARAPGHSFYTGSNPSFPGGPSQMQQELREGYALSAQDIDADAGAGTARIAPVGSAWEIGNWDRLHASDRWHAQNRGTLLASLVIYGTIYGDTNTSDLDLDAVLGSLGLSATDGMELTAYADAVLIPEPGVAAVLIIGVSLTLARRRTGARR